MPTIRALSDLPIVGPKGKTIGWVTHVLFHPEENRAIGIEMRPKPLGFVIEVKPKYFALDAFEIGEDQLTLKDMKAVSGAAAAKRLGVEWDDTIIWHYQDVKTAKGSEVGQVSDVKFAKDGTVRSLDVSGGATADVAHGRLTVPAEEIVGFDGESIRITVKANAAATSGGVAAQAGAGAAIAKHTAKKAAEGALKGGVKAAAAIGKSETAKKAKKGWREFTDAFKEGLDGDD